MVKKKEKIAKYYLNEEGEFVIENYNFSKPFSSFFPGIAGRYGIPMWTFYVNRGQCISSFGIKNKDHAILEFIPANKAWQLVSAQGFRTFIKISEGGKSLFYEPFHNGFTNLGYLINNEMRISPEQLTLREKNLSLKLEVTVKYFNIPNDNYAGLARIISIKNLKAGKRKIEVLDGLPQIVPFGTNNFCLKEMSRTIEAWMNVENMENGVPFYRLLVDPSDRPEVVHIKEGNFYMGFSPEGGKNKIIKPILNPESIFGAVTDFSCPRLFLRKDFNIPNESNVRSKTPSAFLPLNFFLKENGEKTIYSVSGYMRCLDKLNASIKKITANGYLEKKQEENKLIIKELLMDVETKSSSKEFNLYSKQTYLDNLLRGGYPFTFDSGVTVYMYSRKHGDPERDYNKFQLSPTYISQGNGNYRDLNQNRRNDHWFNPRVKEENILDLMNLIQLDGFNPLVIKGASFIINNEERIRSELNNICPKETLEKIIKIFSKKHFAPGELIFFLEDNKLNINIPYDDFLNIILKFSSKINQAEHGEGFWSDHWHYNLDLLESFLGLYPEKEKDILFEKKISTFFDNTVVVKPRCEKYMLYKGAPRQLHSVSLDADKEAMIHKRKDFPHATRTAFGQGDIYYTTLANKLLSLLANKFASLDPFGAGVEMESDKPNWFDSLNGLPALFGSSSCETLELKRLALLFKKYLSRSGLNDILITDEIVFFLRQLKVLTDEYFNNLTDDYVWWDKTHALKEDFRLRTKFGVSGKETLISAQELLNIIEIFLKKLDNGISKIYIHKQKLYHSYFINEVTDYVKLNDNFIKPKSFRQIPLPLFLEGQVHAMRLENNQLTSQSLYKSVKKSALFDKKLEMYKVTAPLSPMPEEIGRCRIFTPGWLENESVWLHMEYKYMLELLKSGLFKEFYADFKKVLIPFQNPEQYGRSILENSSFLASSAFPDKHLQGNGFVARLSGSTAEFLEIWLKINAGINPFYLDRNNELNLRFSPILDGWFFDNKGEYSFNFLGKIKVYYHNPGRKKTFGRDGANIQRISFNDKDGNIVEIHRDNIPSPYAEQIRSRLINKIDIYFG